MSSVPSATVLKREGYDSTRMDAGRFALPGGLSAGRAWRWCMLRTIRDARQAKLIGRPIAPHHLARRFAQRWHQMSDQFGELDRKWFFRRLTHGRHLIGKGEK